MGPGSRNHDYTVSPRQQPASRNTASAGQRWEFPLRKITVGMFLAALAFVVTAVVQMQIDKTLPTFPSNTQGQVKFLNMVNKALEVRTGTNNFILQPFTANENYLTFDNDFVLNVGSGATEKIILQEGTRRTIVILKDSPLSTLSFNDIIKKPDEGVNDIRFFNGYNSTLNVTVGKLDYHEIVSNNMSKYLGVPQGNAHFMIINEVGQECVYSQKLGFGSSYTLVIPPTFTFGQNCEQNIKPGMDMEPNSFHMAWQIPQYFLMTSGEVVFSVTGLEFSYSQAPSNMKAVLQAGWLLTVAVGNIIVLIVAEAASIPEQWAEYILFAALLFLVCIIFAIMAYFYTYTDPAKIEAQFKQTEPEDEKKRHLEMSRKDSLKHNKESRESSYSSSDEDEAKQTKI